MGRGRPRIYHTEEEKIMANRAKSKRSYAKRQASISVKKAVRYRADTKGTSSRNKIIKGASRNKVPTSLDPTSTQGWLSLVSKTLDDFTSLMKGSTRSYIERQYQRYALSERKEVLSDQILELTGLLNTIRRCEGGLLQLAGVGNEYYAAESTRKGIEEALACLEDILCYALCGYSDAVEMYEQDKLMFQAL
ncbi:hypothetical protein EYR38_010721 [Pleurotus pulmonarius]|nr:hypothetical protein EYR38_010721 [Pleurotus pulmonarius]